MSATVMSESTALPNRFLPTQARAFGHVPKETDAVDCLALTDLYPFLVESGASGDGQADDEIADENNQHDLDRLAGLIKSGAAHRDKLGKSDHDADRGVLREP